MKVQGRVRLLLFAILVLLAVFGVLLMVGCSYQYKCAATFGGGTTCTPSGGGIGGGGGGTGVNGPCSTTQHPSQVLFSMDIPTSGTLAPVDGFAIDANGNLTLMCNNVSANLGEIAVVSNKFLYVLDPLSATIAGFSIAHGNSGLLTAIPNQPFAVTDTFQQFHHIVADPLGRFVFVSNFEGNKVHVFLVDQVSGGLTEAAASPLNIAFPNHVAVTPSGNFVFIPSSQFGQISIFTIDAAGTLTPTANSPFLVPAANVGDFPLFAEVHPSGNFLFTADFTSASVFTIDGTTGALAYAPGSPVDLFTPFSVQPFQLAFNNNGQFAYFNGQGNQGVPGYSVDTTTGALTVVSGSPFAQTSVVDLVPNPLAAQMYVQIGNSVNLYAINGSGALIAPLGAPTVFTTTNLVIANVQ